MAVPLITEEPVGPPQRNARFHFPPGKQGRSPLLLVAAVLLVLFVAGGQAQLQITTYFPDAGTASAAGGTR